MDPEADAPIPILDANEPLPTATDVLLSLPPRRSTPPRQAEFLTDTRTKNPANIININWDLKGTKTVDFESMIKMFLLRGRLDICTRADLDGLTNRLPALMKVADTEYKALLQQAIDFCNLDIAKLSSLDKDRVALCRYVKRQMAAFCNTKIEVARYPPLVNALNAILSLDDEQEVIFIVNDPMFVESSHLPSTVTKRKPDIVLIDVESCKRWLDVEDPGTFKQCRERVEKGEVGKGKDKGNAKVERGDVEQGDKGKGKANLKKEKRSWILIWQFWELKKIENKGHQAVFKSAFTMGSLTTPPSGAPAVHSSSALVADSPSVGAKRVYSNELENPRAKRTRPNPIASGGQIIPLPALVPEVDPDVQCAYYAIEMLRVSWKVSHASGILLTDKRLEVLWYDPQGCIRTSSIDIIEQLPLLVVLIRAQRRSGYLRGLRNTPVPGNFELIKEFAPRFQLVGRMTSGGELKVSSTAPSTSTQTSDDSKATHFLKSSWPEDIREREHNIIATAVDRVNTILPESYRPFVLEHIPTISASNEIYDSSTTIIRTLLGLSTDGSRTQYLMCSALLSNLLDVANDFALFRGILYEVVRAHRLLWVIGITHGDVSFHNVMRKPGTMVAVLNDFDLAVVMKPGETNPPRIGSRHTGSPLFMAVDLLGDDASPRLYRHDLESFAWVLLYASICVLNGKENLDVEPIRDWVLVSQSQLVSKKVAFLLRPRTSTERLHNKEWLLSTFMVWSKVFNAFETSGEVLGPEGDTKILGEVLRAWKFENEDWETFIYIKKTQLSVM